MEVQKMFARDRERRTIAQHTAHNKLTYYTRILSNVRTDNVDCRT